MSAPVRIVQAGTDVLRRRAQPVPLEAIGTTDFQALLERMFATMRAAPGVGLAAPQIGVALRVFVVEDSPSLLAGLTEEELRLRERVAVPPAVFINPTVTAVGDETATFFEGCLSVTGYAALVTRHREVEVRALNERAEEVVWRVRGWPARILQHEQDHLDGTLYVDRMLTRSFSQGALVQDRYSGKSLPEILEALRP